MIEGAPHGLHRRAGSISSRPHSNKIKMAANNHWFLHPIFLSFLSIPLRSSASPWLARGTGTSLRVDHGEIFLVSPDTTFSCGFYSSGEGTNAYYFSIWFTHATDRTVVWTANRSREPAPYRCQQLHGVGEQDELGKAHHSSSPQQQQPCHQGLH